MIRHLICLFAVLMILASGSAEAQQVERIAAVINDDIISAREVEGRVKMAMTLSRLQDSVETRRRVIPQVLRKMIDERLQVQEAKRLNISVSPAEVEEGIAAIERQNGMPKGTLIKQMTVDGLDGEQVHRQISDDLLWVKVTTRTLQSNVRVGEEEINERLETISARQGKPEYLLAEIFLPVEDPTQDLQMRTLGERLIDQLRQGAPFPMLAAQFSQSPSAAAGGSMGWISEGMIEDDLLKAASLVPPGNITQLIRIGDGYHVLAVINRRIAGGGGSDGAVFTIAQLVLPMPPAGGPPKDALKARAFQLTQGAPSCDEFAAKGHSLGGHVTRLGPVKAAELPPPVRRSVQNLATGQISPPEEVSEGLSVIMACSRTQDAKASLPSRDQVRRMLEEERLDMLSRRYLRDLRRAAFVDIRM